jgi:cysteine synthase
MKKLTWDEVCEDPVYRALDPRREFMVARYLPDSMNPVAHREIRIAALVPFTTLPHIKTVATIGMLEWDHGHGDQPGYSPQNHTLVADSSGNTAHAAARLARAFGYKHVKLVVASDVPASKVNLLRALSSVEVIHPTGGQSAANRAKEEAKLPGHYHLNQYAHPGNPDAHRQYTGPEIVRALGGQPPAVLTIAMGSGGTLMGVGQYFRKHHPATLILGAQPVLGEQVPGARDERRMSEVVELDWKPYAHQVFAVSRKESFKRTRQLWSAVEPQPGPTSGMAWGGLAHFLERWAQGLKEGTRVTNRPLPEGGFTAAFLCPDDGRFYSDVMIAELDTDQGID